MVKETHSKVLRLVTDLHREKNIDDTTRKWLDPKHLIYLEYYSSTLTKIHKPTITGRPIISGCDGPRERTSYFVDTLLQPLSMHRNHTLKTTDVTNFIEKTKRKTEHCLFRWTSQVFTQIYYERGH